MRRPYDQSEEPEGPEAEQPAEAPLPDRTRVQPSPFANDEAGPRKPASRKGTRNGPSVIVDAGAAAEERRPPARPGRRAPDAEQAWDAPADQDESTNPAAPAALRPERPARRSSRVARVEESAAPAADPNATRIAPAPSRREARAADDNATHAGAPFTIEVKSGPDAGMRMPVRGGRMIIGRGDGCDLRLSDNSASRRHAELVAAGTGLVVRDLGSGNGTRVNGTKVNETAAAHGDEIGIGQTVLLVVDDLKRFEEERAPKAPPPRPPPRAAPALLEAQPEDEAEAANNTARVPLPHRVRSGGSAGGALLARFAALPRPMRLILVGGVALLVTIVLVGALASLKPKAPPGPPPQEAQYDALFEEGKKLLRAGDYEGALERFQAAGGIIDKPELSRYVETCERDGKGKKQLDQAKRLAALGEYEQAIGILEAIDERAAAFDEGKELVAKYEEGRIQAVTEQVRKAIAAGEIELARGLAAKVPEPQAGALRREIDEEERDAEKRAVADARDAKVRAQRARDERARRTREEVDTAIAGVVRKIDSGNFDGALRELDHLAEGGSAAVQAKAKQLRKLIPQFSIAYQDGVSKYNGGAYEAAALPLMRALTLYEDMDIDGKLDGKLKERAAKAASMKGKAALARQEYGTAAKAFRQALELNGGDREAKDGLAEISRRAKDVYLEGYVEMNRSPDVARRRFREVMEMVAPSNEVHQDAKRRLAELDAK